MQHYVILSKLTDDGRKTIKEKPERLLEVNKELGKMGITVKEQFVVLGEYDFVNIIDAPDLEAVMKMSIELGSRGSVQLISLPAMTAEEFVKKMK